MEIQRYTSLIIKSVEFQDLTIKNNYLYFKENVLFYTKVYWNGYEVWFKKTIILN